MKEKTSIKVIYAAIILAKYTNSEESLPCIIKKVKQEVKAE